ncbi:nucleotidyltransferase domain-containing protein [Candidatus Parcubacteria bacterium]|nr:MAG: nucleotidyltransferase domain-containing protein [Candidatus Parcubacteria bacterium]
METVRLTDDQQKRLRRIGAVLCYAHGSVIHGTSRQDSDLDIAVLFERMPEDPVGMTGRILGALEGYMPGHSKDIAILNEASPLFRQIVASTGMLLYARSPEDTLQFELRSMHEYEYSRHIVRLGQEIVMKRAGL